jgi:uncharacterized protein (DUF433 family)
MEAGTGIYTSSEAAALLHERPETVRRWAYGYRRTRMGGRTSHPPLIHTELPTIEGQDALTFVELIELLYIRAFERAGVSWNLIREAAGVAARMFSTRHPFALRQVYVDPRSVYGSVREDDGSESLVELVGHGQHAMPQLVKPFLEQIDFGADEVARRWWPMGREGGVVVDPLIAFGMPVVTAVGMRVHSLASAYDAEVPAYGTDGAVGRVAWTYDIGPEHVRTALEFREWLRTAA